jgi:hypothetical protein
MGATEPICKVPSGWGKKEISAPLIRNPWLETRASLSNRAIFSAGGVKSSTFLSKLNRKSHDISSSHVNHRELLVKLTINTLEKRSVVSQWWSMRPHGRYHHGSNDH